MKLPRILIGTPTYQGKEYCRELFVKHIQNIDYPNFQWKIVDNTKHNRYFSKLNRLYPGHIVRVPRGNNSRDALANASNYLRRKAIDEGYDYLLMIESDLFPPPDVIWRLLRHQKEVVGLPYEIGHGDDRSLCVFMPKKVGENRWGTRRLKPEETDEFLNGELRQVHGMGVGCVLIHKSILEEFPFWYSSVDDERMKGQKIRKHPDVYFYLDLWNNGKPVYVDTSVLVHHQNSNWADVEDI